jgi:CubicO group peptidase (beta-lactamase class C family)
MPALQFVALLLWLLAGCTPVRQPLERRLPAIVEQPDAPLASLAVAVVAGDAIIYEGYWGNRRITAGPQASLPVTAATKFRVASISKLVTALGAMRLVEAGKLQLDRDISDYLGFRLRNPYYPERPITARMLLSHTSSLRDAGSYAVPLPSALKDLFEPAGAFYAGGAHFAQVQPGAYFAYANLNYGVLGTVMEAAAGERFDRYMQAAVLDPLAIDGGYLLTNLSGPGLAQVATLYTRQDANGVWNATAPWVAQFDSFSGGRPPAPLPAPHLGPQPANAEPSPAVLLAAYEPGTNATIFAPHAGLRISARDLAKIVLLLLREGRYAGEQVVSPITVRRMLREQWRYDPQGNNGATNGGLLRAWGLGLQHTTGSQDASGGDRLAAGSTATFWGHRGEAYGFLGGLWFDPQREVGFVFLAGGLGDDPLRHPGQYSSFNAWEEAIQTALLDEITWWEATH